MAAYASRDEWIRWGIEAAYPDAANAYCQACLRRFLPPCDPVPGMPPLLFTSHDIFDWFLVSVTGYTSTSRHAFGASFTIRMPSTTAVPSSTPQLTYTRLTILDPKGLGGQECPNYRGEIYVAEVGNSS